MPAVGNSHHHKATGKSLIALLCLVLVLAACGDMDETGPQFVTDVHPTATVTQVAAVLTPTLPAGSNELETEPTIEFSTRSAPRFAYLILDDVLTSYDSVARVFTPLEISSDLILIDHAASPTGDRVGILAVQDSRLVVQFFGADGLALTDAILLSVPAIPPVVDDTPATPGATPMATARIPDRINQMHVDWIPQGNGVLVSGPGVAQRVSMNGTVMPISRIGVTGTVMKAIWSPMDSQVAIQTQLQNGDQSVYMLDTGQDEARQLEALGDTSGQGLSNLQWMPSGLGMVVVVGEVSNGIVMSGQLYTFRLDEDSPKLIATSGQGGPNATITHAVVSPDGHSVVYAIMVRDLGEWHLHSLLIRDLKTGPAVAIPTESGAPLTALLWTEEGIIWQQADGTLNVVDNSMVPRPLGTEPLATPVVDVPPQATPQEDLAPVG